MGTYKKKTFKERFKDEEDLEESVDADGGLIGDKTKNFNSDTEVMTDTPFTGDEEAKQGRPQTGDEFAKIAGQRRRFPYFGTNYSSGKRAAMAESAKILAKERMEGLIEDLMSDRTDNLDMVKGRNVQDINRNKIPDIEDITNNNQALSHTLKSVIDIMNGQDINGDGIGVMLNYIVSNVDTSQMPQDYKRIISGKL